MPAASSSRAGRQAIEAHMNGQLVEARKNYVSTLKAGQDGVAVCRCYARLLNEAGEHKQATEILKRARAHEATGKAKGETSGKAAHNGLFLKETSAATDLALQFFHEGETAKVLGLAQQAIRINPADDLAHEMILSILGKADRVDDAINFYHQAPKNVRFSFPFCKVMAHLLAASNRFEESLRIRNNGLNIPEQTLKKITGHVRSPFSAASMISHLGAGPHSEVRLLNIEAECEPTPNYVALDDVTVMSGEWYVLSQKQTLFMDLNHGTPTGDPTPYYQDPTKSGKQIVLPEPTNTKIDKAILIGGDPNYYHWVVDFLPKLLALGKTPGLGDYPILVHEELSSYQLEGLSLAGIDPTRLLKLEYPGCYPCGELIVPLFPPESPEMEWSRSRRSAVAWLRTLIEPKTGGGRRIYISRQDSTRRKIANEDVLIAVLRKEGFDILVLSEYSQAEQIRIFSEADVVVASHGAGLGNLAFAPDGCRIVEIRDPRWNNQQFQALAAIRGQSFKVVMCLSFLTDRRLPINTDSFITDQAIAEILKLVRNPDADDQV